MASMVAVSGSRSPRSYMLMALRLMPRRSASWGWVSPFCSRSCFKMDAN